MGIWGRWLLPRAIDKLLDNPELNERRRLTCAGLSGRVLEVGFGSGLNVPLYPAEVTSVLAVEPSDTAWRLSEQRRRASAVGIVRAGLNGQWLGLDNASVDAALSTMTLCSIPELAIALGEIKRVLKPGGTLHFLEHGRAPDADVREWQRRLNPLQGRLAGGCRLDVPIDEVLTAAGFDIVELTTGYGPTRPKAMGFLYRGVARRP